MKSKNHQSWTSLKTIRNHRRNDIREFLMGNPARIMEIKDLYWNESFPQSRACEFWTWNRIWSITSCTRGLEFWFGYRWIALNESYKSISEHIGHVWGWSRRRIRASEIVQYPVIQVQRFPKFNGRIPTKKQAHDCKESWNRRANSNCARRGLKLAHPDYNWKWMRIKD